MSKISEFFVERKGVIIGVVCGLAVAGVAAYGIVNKINNNNGNEQNSGDKTKTQISVYNYDGGIGTQWLYNVEKEFEELYKDVSFEEGKKGVDLSIAPGKQNNLTAGASSGYNIIFGESIFVADSASQNLFLDISDIVTGSLSEVSNGKETGSIESKLDNNMKDYLTCINNKYYALPHYETYAGVTYDKDVFDEYSLYFKSGFNSGWTNVDSEKSCGPDGIKGTADDGLPSSIQEFYKLMDAMVVKGVVPFIWSGQYTDYTNNLILGTWANMTGYDEMLLGSNFDSSISNVKNHTVTGFDSLTGKPIVSEDTITTENGYKTKSQEGYYYGLKLLEKVFSNSKYYSSKITGVESHLDAQEDFIFSNLEGNPIGMIMEGSYWYNEAHDALLRSENTYKNDAKNRNFRWMPLPVQPEGQVEEGQGKQQTLVSNLYSFGFINGNIKDNAGLVKACKTFMQFLYTDEQLQKFTVETGVAKGLTYSLTNEQVDSLAPFFRSLYEIKQNSKIVNPVSANPVFIRNASKLALIGASSFWLSDINGSTYANAHQAFKEHFSAEQYFLGNAISVDDWNTKYGA